MVQPPGALSLTHRNMKHPITPTLSGKLAKSGVCTQTIQIQVTQCHGRTANATRRELNIPLIFSSVFGCLHANDVQHVTDQPSAILACPLIIPLFQVLSIRLALSIWPELDTCQTRLIATGTSESIRLIDTLQ